MLSRRRIIDAPAAVAWRLLTDTEAWPRWGPSVRAVEAPARFIGDGMRGRVQTPLGLWLPFEVTAWEPERFWHWRVFGVPATGHSLRPLDPGTCEVTFTVPAWAPFYLPVCTAAIRRLDELARTGASGTG